MLVFCFRAGRLSPLYFVQSDSNFTTLPLFNLGDPDIGDDNIAQSVFYQPITAGAGEVNVVGP